MIKKWYEDKSIFDGNEVLVKDRGNCLFVVDECIDGILFDANGNQIGIAEFFTMADIEERNGLKIK